MCDAEKKLDHADLVNKPLPLFFYIVFFTKHQPSRVGHVLPEELQPLLFHELGLMLVDTLVHALDDGETGAQRLEDPILRLDSDAVLPVLLECEYPDVLDCDREGLEVSDEGLDLPGDSSNIGERLPDFVRKLHQRHEVAERAERECNRHAADKGTSARTWVAVGPLSEVRHTIGSAGG